MGYSAPNVDDAMLALQVANFETAQQAVEQATQKADQRKGELLCFYEKLYVQRARELPLPFPLSVDYFLHMCLFETGF